MSVCPKYPSIRPLYKAAEILSCDEVVATEKIHGTNFRIFIPAGSKSVDDIRFGGRNQMFEPGDDGFFKGRCVAWFKSRPELLERMIDLIGDGTPDVTIYGECYGSGIQKGVVYATDDRVEFRAFDIMLSSGTEQQLIDYDWFMDLCESIGLPTVPAVYRGKPSLGQLNELLERNSVVAKQAGVELPKNVSEGVVVRPTKMFRNDHGELVLVKHKSDAFAEAASHPKTTKLTPELLVASGAAKAFSEQFVTPGRVSNVLGHLRASGVELVGGMPDMAAIMPAIIADIRKECAEEWAAAVANGATDKAIGSSVNATLGKVYRRMLNEAVAA